MTKLLALIAMLISYAGKTDCNGNAGLMVSVTNTGTACNVIISQSVDRTVTIIYKGTVSGTEGFKNALRAANTIIKNEPGSQFTDNDITYTVTHVEPDGTKIGPFRIHTIDSVDADVMAGTGKTFDQLCPFQSCFEAESTVTTISGPMTMAELYRYGEEIKVLTTGGHFSPVKFWLHAEPQKPTEFLRITTVNGESVSLTRGHLIFKTSCARLQSQTVRAEKISPGDCLMVDNGDGNMQPQRVVSVDKFNSVGIYSPVTASGDLLVDNILASCYSEVEAVQLQSLMFDYVNIVKSVAKQLLSTDLFSVIFGSIDNVASLPESVRQFLYLSTKFN